MPASPHPHCPGRGGSWQQLGQAVTPVQSQAGAVGASCPLIHPIPPHPQERHRGDSSPSCPWARDLRRSIRCSERRQPWGRDAVQEDEAHWVPSCKAPRLSPPLHCLDTTPPQAPQLLPATRRLLLYVAPISNIFGLKNGRGGFGRGASRRLFNNCFPFCALACLILQ